MPDFNRVTLIGRLTRDPETKAFPNGGRVVCFGFAVNNRKKDSLSGQWANDPVFLDMEIFAGRENDYLATQAEKSLHRGSTIFLEGHIRMDQWKDKDGAARRKMVIVIDRFQFLDPKPAAGPATSPSERAPYAGWEPEPQTSGDSSTAPF